MTTLKELEDIFRYHPPNDVNEQIFPKLRGWGLDMSKLIIASMPACRERSIALTKLEECIMWANKGIARNVKPRD